MTKSSSSSISNNKLSLDELTALCEEMVSLSRAGVPLDDGLLRLAQDLPKGLSDRAQQIGEQLQAGQSLADALASDDEAYPEIYKGVIEAGLRSGKLTVALEGFVRLAKQLSEVRRVVTSALIYPLLLLGLLVSISLGLIMRFGPSVLQSLLSLKGRGAKSDWAYDLLEGFAAWSQWFWVIPTALLFFSLVVFLVALLGGFSDLVRWMSWIPGVRRLLRNSGLQRFTQVLSLLVKQEVPLQQALPLAGAASGEAKLQTEAKQLAEQITRGDTQMTVGKRGSIPPFLRWNLLRNQRGEKLAISLDRASDSYQRKTEAASQWLSKSLPVLFSLLLGGVVSVLYAATVFVPWYTLMLSLGDALEAM